MRRIGLYSLIAIVSLALVSLTAAGVVNALNQGDDRPIEQANTPTVSEPPEPMPETEPEEDEEKSENKQENKEGEKEREAPEDEGQEASEREEWREIAERRDAEQQAAGQAADQAAADQAAADQAAADQAAVDQAAADQAAAQDEAAQTAVPSSSALSLTVPSAGIQNDPVTDSVAESVLANGAGKIPSTGFPWQPGSNTYIAAHVYGYPGTGSWQQFAEIPNMSMGDQIFLTDSGGTTYEYQVSEILTVAPTDTWVAGPTGQDTVSLQTCVGPGWSERLVVRGTLVETSQA